MFINIYCCKGVVIAALYQFKGCFIITIFLYLLPFFGLVCWGSEFCLVNMQAPALPYV